MRPTPYRGVGLSRRPADSADRLGHRDHVGALVIHSLMYGPQAAFIAEQFSPRLRCTGSSLACTLAGVIGGAIAPLLFTTLLGTHHVWTPLAIYIALTAALTVTGLFLGRDAAPAHSEEPAPLLFRCHAAQPHADAVGRGRVGERTARTPRDRPTRK